MAEFLGISSVAHMAVRVLEKHKGVVSMSFTAAVSSAQLCGAFWWLCTAKLSSPACHQADSDRKEAEQAWPWQQCGLAAGRRAVGSWLLQKYSVEWSWTGSALCFCLGDQEFLIPKGLCIISCFFLLLLFQQHHVLQLHHLQHYHFVAIPPLLWHAPF